MFPYRDNIPARTVPFVTVGIIILNVYVFLQELRLSPEQAELLILRKGLVPARVTACLDAGRCDPATVLWPFITCMFLHGGWLHILGNMWYLSIFGDNVEDRLGHFRYLVFYLLSGIAGSIAQIVAHPQSTLPMVGASGAIAGVLGAYAITYPFARVLTIVPIFLIIIRIWEIPAFIVLGFWFVMQLLNGQAALAQTAHTAGGVAWWAHIGGFVAGVALVLLLAPARRKVARRRRPSEAYA
ncbi:MAG: rhomboid family intramembrane serine protease [Planctomycetes bacterium]|nr:rhomboid family intramembrane serine protease [Planctomycetota bacterium]